MIVTTQNATYQFESSIVGHKYVKRTAIEPLKPFADSHKADDGQWLPLEVWPEPLVGYSMTLFYVGDIDRSDNKLRRTSRVVSIAP